MGVPCSQLRNAGSNKCITKVRASGASIGLDAGSTYMVAQAIECIDGFDPSQTFDLVRGDQGGFPDAFPVRSPPILTDVAEPSSWMHAHAPHLSHS